MNSTTRSAASAAMINTGTAHQTSGRLAGTTVAFTPSAFAPRYSPRPGMPMRAASSVPATTDALYAYGWTTPRKRGTSTCDIGR